MRERGTCSVIENIVSPNPKEKHISRCIRLFDRIAQAYLKRKIAQGTLSLNRIQLKLEDLSWDCIAGLFERDNTGSLVQLQTYFDNYDVADMSDHEAYSACRRLVFSKVNDGIFRNFRRIDPALGKIIRNLKLAIRKNPEVDLEHEKEMNRIVFQNGEDDQKPLMPVEILRIRLTERLDTKMFISETLEAIKEIICEQELYRKQYPLVEVAKITRYAYTQLHENGDLKSQTVSPQTPLYEEDIREFINDSITHVRNEMYDTYVTKDKLDEQTFDIYFQCIKEILMDLFVKEGTTSSYFTHLEQKLDNLSRNAYRRKHRGYLEYLVKKARADLLHKLKKEF